MKPTIEQRARDAGAALRTAADLRPAIVSSNRSRRAPIVALAAAAVVIVIAAVAVGLTRHGSHNGGGGLTIAALAATTQQQSARITITETVSAPDDPHPERFVTTGLSDYRTGDGRFDLATQSGSDAPKPFQTELVVSGHRYVSIGLWLQGVPESVIRSKKWIDEDTPLPSLQTPDLNPFDPLGTFKDLHISLVHHGSAKLNGQTLQRYTASKRISSPQTDGPVQKLTLVFDVYVDRHNRVAHIQVDEKALGTSSTVQIDFSDYGVRVDVAAPPANLVIRASELPPSSTPTPINGRAGALVLRQDIDSSAAECKIPGTLRDTGFRANGGPEVCTQLGATVVTGDDVISAQARPEARSLGGWCVAPILTDNGFAQLQRYIQANEPVPDVFVISHGRFLGAVEINSPIHNGDCWITTDRMTETAARTLAAQLSNN